LGSIDRRSVEQMVSDLVETIAVPV